MRLRTKSEEDFLFLRAAEDLSLPLRGSYHPLTQKCSGFRAMLRRSNGDSALHGWRIARMFVPIIWQDGDMSP